MSDFTGMFDQEGLVNYKREDLSPEHQHVYDLAIHSFLQEQSVRYRKLNGYGVREGVYMAITHLGVPVEQFEWMNMSLEELQVRADLYKLTGNVTL